MKSENRIAKAATIILAVALIGGATGCATQATGGSKLGYDELMAGMNEYDNVIKVCEQSGAVMHCSYEDRERVREENERLVEALRYRSYR